MLDRRDESLEYLLSARCLTNHSMKPTAPGVSLHGRMRCRTSRYLPWSNGTACPAGADAQPCHQYYTQQYYGVLALAVNVLVTYKYVIAPAPTVQHMA